MIKNNRPDVISPEILSQAIAVLRSGGLLGLPTETVYGLAADASNPRAVAKIFAAKGRPADHPLIVHIAHVQQLGMWAKDIPGAAYALAAAFWPGPLTLILPRAPHVLLDVTGGQDTVGIRIPNHPVAQAVLSAFGGGVAAPSANRFGRISPTTAQHVQEELGPSVELVLEGGPAQVGIESTIVDLTGNSHHAQILRPGAITPAQLATVLGYLPKIRTRLSEPSETSPSLPRVSGDLLSHYAPRTPLKLFPWGTLLEHLNQLITAGKQVAVVAQNPPSKDFAGHQNWQVLPLKAEDYAQRLYATLRQADESGSDQILWELPPDTPDWDAIRDRLGRAAARDQSGDD